MAFDPFYSSSPSDSGLLDGGLLDGASAPFVGGNAKSRREPSNTNVPNRDEYVAPTTGPIDAEAPEDSLRDVPLPEGFMARLRGFVSEL